MTLMNITSYNDVAYLDTDNYKLPLGLNGTLVPVDIINHSWALMVSPYGWGVYSRWFGNGGIREEPWGGPPVAAGNIWAALNDYIGMFVDENGYPIINIDPEDEIYQDVLPECDEGDWQCLGTTLQTCVGGRWRDHEYNSPICQDEPPVCTEGDTRCDGTTLQKCINNHWVNYEYNSTQCGYIPGECVEGAVRCVGTTLQKCVNGHWEDYLENYPGCGGGGVVCEEGSFKCVGTTKYQCVDNEWVPVEYNSISCGYVPPTPPGPTDDNTVLWVLAGAGVVTAGVAAYLYATKK
jgi:hypothetical protein